MTPLDRQRMPPEMNKHEDIAKALKVRLSELTSCVAEIDSELRKPLSADFEDGRLTSKIRTHSK